MWFLTLYGVLLAALSVYMIVSPEGFVRRGVAYCGKSYMHATEILICLVPGAFFARFGPDTHFPAVLEAYGFLLLAVGAGLVLTPPSLHRRFGVWSIRKVGRWFRPAGVVSLLAGAGIVYAAAFPG